MCSGNSLVDALKDKKLNTGKALSLALYMYTNAEIGTNIVRKSLAELSDYVDAQVSYTSVLLKQLVECGICRKRRRGEYFMNPEHGWKGTRQQAEYMRKLWNSGKVDVGCNLDYVIPEVSSIDNPEDPC